MTDENNFRKRVFSSLIWKFLERSGTQGIQFIIQVILARLLLPEDYGLLAIVAVFITLANIVIQGGFNTALVQKKDADETDFSSVFYLSIIIAGILYITLYLLAPYIGEFYSDNRIVSVIRVLSIVLFFGAINSIQIAYIMKNLMFKKLFFSSLGSTALSGIVGVYTAYIGWGVWALVTQQITNYISITLILWFTLKWRPQRVFSINSIKNLFSFGSRLLSSSVLNVLYTDLRTLTIGKVFSSNILGFYNRGRQFPQLIVDNVSGSINSVMLPTMSTYQDNLKKIKTIVRRANSVSSYMIFPLMVGLFVIARPLITLLLTERWLPAVPFLQIYCLSYALRPIHATNVQAINSIGKSDIYLRIEIIRTIIGVGVLVITIPFGIYAVALGELVSSIISTILYGYPNRNLIKYSFKEQIIDIAPGFVLSIIMGVLISLLKIINTTNLNLIVIQVLFGSFIYLFLSWLLKLSSFNYLINNSKRQI